MEVDNGLRQIDISETQFLAHIRSMTHFPADLRGLSREESAARSGNALLKEILHVTFAANEISFLYTHPGYFGRALQRLVWTNVCTAQLAGKMVVFSQNNCYSSID